MSTNYSVQKLTLTDNRILNTNFDDFLNDNTSKDIEVVKTEDDRDDYFPLKDKDGNYCWVQLDENRNVTEFWRYGKNDVTDIIIQFKFFLKNQYGWESLQKYENYGIGLDEILVIDEYNFGDFQRLVKSKGETLWNEIFTDFTWDEMMKEDFEINFADDFWDFLNNNFTLEGVQRFTLDHLVDMYFENIDTTHYCKDFVVKHCDLLIDLCDEVIMKKHKESLLK